MRVQTWKITGQGYHFGRQGLGQEETGVAFPSDSLFAALVSRLAERAGARQVEEFIAPFLSGNPPFALSSCFPFAGNVRFFPVPVILHSSNWNHDRAGLRPKDIKRLRYISESLFLRLVGGEDLPDLFAQAFRLQDNQLLVARDEIERLPDALQKPGAALWSVEKRPRVTLGRAAQNSAIYFTGRVAFAGECGLWLGIRWLSQDRALAELIETLLADLADSGLGAERSAGFGACEIKRDVQIDLPDPAGKPWVSLSRYLPRREEMSCLQAAYASYKLEQVGGWLSSPARPGQRRKTINLLAEGALLAPAPAGAPGSLADVRPSYPANPDPVGHPVYRSGIALAVGVEGVAS